MDDSVSVGMRQALRRLLRILEDFIQRERRTAAFDPFELGFKRSTGQELHREKVPIACSLHGVNRRNIWVVECRERIGFLKKALKVATRGVYLRRKKLERDEPVQLLVEGFIDDAHSVFAE